MMNKSDEINNKINNKIETYEDFITEHRRKVSLSLNKVLWACIIAGPFILIGVLLGVFKNVGIWAGPLVGVALFIIALIHKKMIEKNVNVVVTSVIAFVAIDCLLVFMDNIHLAIYLSWVLTPILSLFFCDYLIYFSTVCINYCFMLTSVWLTAPYYVDRRIDMETNLAYFLSRSGNFTVETMVLIAAGLFLCKLSVKNYKELFESQEKLYENQRILYDKQNQLYANEKHIKEQMEVLASLSDIYDYAALINPDDGSETEMRHKNEEGTQGRQYAEKYALHAGKLIRYVADDYVDAFETFIDVSDVRTRLQGKKSISEEFLDTDTGWFRVQFISVGHAGEEADNIIYTIQNIDTEKKEHEKLAEAATTLNMRISSIANIYMTVHELDIASNEVTEIKSQSQVVNNVLSDFHGDPQGMLRKVMKAVTDESCQDDVMHFIDLSTLEQRLSKTDTIAVEYMNKQKQWRRGRFVASRRDEKGRLTRVLWMSEDIDNEKRERNELINTSERAIAASEAKSAFLSNMSHEIRTPINAVLGMNEMILRESEDENVLAYANSIRTAGNTLLGLVNDILDFSKIEAGKMEIIPVDYDLSSVINDLVNMIRTKADDKGLTLELDINKDVPKLLHGDEVRLRQVITNLLTNAVKYTEKGTVTLCIRYETIAEEPDAILLKVIVRDTGIGIKKEDMKKLFSEFDRIEEERNRNVEGTGLGMSITKKLLEMMDSSLVVESIYGLGSKFSFEVKQTVVKWDALGNYEEAYKEAIGKRQKYHEKFRAPKAEILVIDDMPMNHEVFKNLLKRTKVKIDTAINGDDGLAMSYDKKYDVIFIDHMMPDKDGIETLRELRSRPKDPNLKTPTICLTANALSGAREHYLAEGFDDYLSKPIDTVRLENMLLEYLPPEKIEKTR